MSGIKIVQQEFMRKLLADMRYYAGLSFDDLSRKSGLSERLLRALELGDRKLTFEYIEQILNVYNLFDFKGNLLVDDKSSDLK